jgi:hypothetical protein
MPENLSLWYDDIYAAIRGFVSFAGGSKRVGPKVFPHKGDKAGAWLDDCLNPDRPAKLGPEELVLICKLAAEVGFHGLMEYLARDLGYEIKPLSPQESKKRAKRVRRIALLDELKRLEDEE